MVSIILLALHGNHVSQIHQNLPKIAMTEELVKLAPFVDFVAINILIIDLVMVSAMLLHGFVIVVKAIRKI